jgi:predicted dehydrogenase
MTMVRMAMIGGGAGAFIGNVHRMAARLDGQVELVAGAFSSDAAASRAFGPTVGLPAARSYGTWQELLAGEAARPDGAQFVAIVTPNDLHLPIATAALDRGFHVLSDKPATRNLAEAHQLRDAVARSGRLYALTHVYLGYPMIVEARHRIATGQLGAVHRVVVHYTQGWLSTALEAQGNKQAGWRTDPARSGPGGSIGDIGVHAFTLAEYVCGLPVERLCGDLGRVVAGRAVDDDAVAMLRFQGDVRGVLTASQVSTGEQNDVALAVYGTAGGLQWSHRAPGSLALLAPNGERREITAGAGQSNLCQEALRLCRLPAGHPEGFIEAFANLYTAFADDVRSFGTGIPLRSPAPIAAGVRGMAFIEAMLSSDAAGQRWADVKG